MSEITPTISISFEDDLQVHTQNALQGTVTLKAWMESDEVWVQIVNPSGAELDLLFIDRELLPFARRVGGMAADADVKTLESLGAGTVREVIVLQAA